MTTPLTTEQIARLRDEIASIGTDDLSDYDKQVVHGIKAEDGDDCARVFRCGILRSRVLLFSAALPALLDEVERLRADNALLRVWYANATDHAPTPAMPYNIRLSNTSAAPKASNP